MPSLDLRPAAALRQLKALAAFGLILALSGCASAGKPAPEPRAPRVVEAREAMRRHDTARLASLRDAALAANDPLANWIAYWELSSRLRSAEVAEVEAFYQRWNGNYVEDRLRNDWLLELGRRRDWDAFVRDKPRFRMDDDREVDCYAIVAESSREPRRDLRERALQAWLAEREPDDGCTLMANTLHDAGVFDDSDVWRRARAAAEIGRLNAMRAALEVISPVLAKETERVLDQPLKYLQGLESAPTPDSAAMQIGLLAIARVAASDSDAAAGLLDSRWQAWLPRRWASWAWSVTARQAALHLSPDAPADYRRALDLLEGQPPLAAGWSVDALVWSARSALREVPVAAAASAASGAQAASASAMPQPAMAGTSDYWRQIAAAIDRLPPSEANEPTWIFWRAQALLGDSPAGAAGDARRAQAARLLARIANPFDFYGRLASEQVGADLAMPAPPPAPTAEERTAATNNGGLGRAMLLVSFDLRDEARREWNYSLRGLGERELHAAAQLACDASDWQLCINTSERMRGAVDVAQRYPLPFADAIAESVRDSLVDTAFVLGLIRQETRFMPQLKSSAGANGLMQLMPRTARWLAKKLGLPNSINQHLLEPESNIRLGTAYLRMLLDDFEGSQAMAAAAYNAGPSRPRRWREGPVLAPAAWIENIPFNETRDYVKKVLANADVYATLLSPKTPPSPLSRRLGAAIGPRAASAPAEDKDMP